MAEFPLERVASNSYLEFEIQKNEFRVVLAKTGCRMKRLEEETEQGFFGNVLSFLKANQERSSESYS